MLFSDQYIDLNETEQYIYQYVSEHPDELEELTIRQFGQKVNASPSTIVRFCRKFNCSGYSEFKIRLKDFRKKSSYKPVKKANLDFSLDPILRFLNQFNAQDYMNTIEAIAKKMMQRELLVFLGVGASGFAASYGSYLFTSLTAFSISITDPADTAFTHLMHKFGANIMFVICSVCGEQPSLLHFLDKEQIDKENILAITNSSNCPIANRAGYSLSYYIDVQKDGENNLTSQLPAIAILELLSKTAASIKEKNEALKD